MKKKVSVSIIIPCYNAEKYIRKCIDSVLNQTFKDFELICVNDGSTDSTLDILKEYEKKNENMLVVSKKNEGGKNVTKTGLKYANGDYICAIDNDDYIDKDFIKELYTCITKENADMSVCGFQREDYVTKKVYSVEMNKLEGTYNIYKDYGIILEVNTSMWNKMFKKDIITSLLDFKFTALGLGDMIQMAYMYSIVNKVAFTKDILYYYQVREGSNIATMKSNVVDSIYDNLIRIKKEYKSDMYEIIDAFAFLHLGVSLMYRLKRAEPKRFKELYNQNLTILNKNFNKWKHNKYYSLRYILKNKGRNIKLYICYVFYRLHLFGFFIKTYDFLTSTFKFDIKW